MSNIRWFKELGMKDVELVGGKNASLGEMINHVSRLGIQVPDGFATTAEAFRTFLEANQLTKRINAKLENLNVDNVRELVEAGKEIRQWVIDATFTPDFEAAVRQAYQKLTAETQSELTVAVRSSATAEDLPEASFAGQQETFLNVTGIDDVLISIKHVFASLYNDRAIAYRVHHNFAHADVALSAGIQRMARSDKGSSGVMFSMDTESGYDKVVLITAAYGLGETVVQGAVNPDEFYVFKPTLAQNKPAILRKNLGSKAIKMIYAAPNSGKKVETITVPNEEQTFFCLTDAEIEQLARYAVAIEKHYQRPMDIEWAKDGLDGKLYILQARPETVKSRSDYQIQERYILKEKSNTLAKGRSIGQKIGKGKVRVLTSIAQMDRVKPGDVLVTDMTDPDWEPIMKRASAIVTNRGGRTCHAAIIARELGIPAVVGCVDATKKIKDEMDVTVSCADGEEGHIYEGLLDFEIKQIHLKNMPKIAFKINMNVGNPDRAFNFQFLPNFGVGLARLEFIIAQMIGIHPRAILNIDTVNPELKNTILAKTNAYASPKEFYIERLKEGIATIAAAFHEKPVIVRMSDFKSNEYANLIGGDIYEPHEENPMLGFRGASRYIDPSFKDCFQLECEAIKRVRNVMGLTNVEVMIPFVRTLTEAKLVIDALAENGLRRGENDLRIIMMCEIPSNALLAEEFLEYFDGFSIGSNDMTQLTLGLDRDSALIANSFDERNPAVKKLLHMAIQACRKQNKYIGICGQGPSDHPDLAKWLMEEGIESVSLNPDSVVDTWMFLAK